MFSPFSKLKHDNIPQFVDIDDLKLPPSKKEKKSHSTQKQIRQDFTVKEDYGIIESKSSNMYIDRWKKLNLYRSPEFPLERLAFLNSVTHLCNQEAFLFLRKFLVKRLASRKVNQSIATKVPPQVGDRFLVFTFTGAACLQKQESLCCWEKGSSPDRSFYGVEANRSKPSSTAC
ncbi:hypothetical protein CEXT_695421 [Caerostris extrusa]|uniref:Uncharacterized protein n=1 Tax=Caerostris extrusa TaxID=172846 RepID=A0AAV4R0K4_CAEEX|nr:hypothetical protein CEXT_695421 [Caerostris extrusa]